MSAMLFPVRGPYWERVSVDMDKTKRKCYYGMISQDKIWQSVFALNSVCRGTKNRLYHGCEGGQQMPASGFIEKDEACNQLF